MRQYGIYSAKEYLHPERWEVSKKRSNCLILTSDDAEFEKSKREEQNKKREEEWMNSERRD